MKELISEINSIKGVKNTKVQNSSTLKIDLFSKGIPGREAEKLHGDLRKITPKIKDKLEQARQDTRIKGWDWSRKPEKQYDETSVNTEKVSDRKPVGHKPPYYTVSVRK